MYIFLKACKMYIDNETLKACHKELTLSDDQLLICLAI